MNRETWLNKLAERMAPRFEELGAPLPPFRVSVGFTSGGMNSESIGECWDKSASRDERFEIFITPGEASTEKVAFILCHELIHAAVGLEHGHKGEFARVALALGFPRPLTRAGEPSADFQAWLRPMLAKLGPIPHAELVWRQRRAKGEPRRSPTVTRSAGGVTPAPPERASSRPPKQSTRLLKCECTECGYTVRTTAKWLEVGRPHCPNHGPMEVTEKETPA